MRWLDGGEARSALAPGGGNLGLVKYLLIDFVLNLLNPIRGSLHNYALPQESMNRPLPWTKNDGR